MISLERNIGVSYNKGKIIPLGAYVEFTPTTPADIKLLHEMGEKKLPGIFIGYHELAGGIDTGWWGQHM